jgi:hypothetical protein
MPLIILLIWMFMIASYCVNIYDLTQLDFEAPYKAEILRGIGTVVPPIGVVLGFIPINDDKLEELI